LLKDPNAVMYGYPHELAGGMLQRAMIALALALEPDIVIADEPTTAHDTVSQFEVLEQFVALRERIGCATIFVTHDLGIVRRIADDMLVMKDGAVVERGKARDLFASARHEYTRRLVSAKLALNRHFDQLMGGGGDACHGQRQQDL
uniref:ATP-binding cassette domain-containing protein n=1 Tax=Cohnella sp. GbtcB17 TaxID=2824762 RepID=UPI001C30CA63